MYEFFSREHARRARRTLLSFAVTAYRTFATPMPASAVVPADRDLDQVLAAGTHEELSWLVDVLTDGGEGRWALSARMMKTLQAHKDTCTLEAVAGEIATEIRAFGGHTIVNLVRRSGPAYRVIVEDVADELGLKGYQGKPVHEVEALILGELARRAPEARIDSSAPDLMRATLKTAAKASSAVGARAALAGMGGRAAALATPPLAVALSGVWIIHDAARPASRVTVPVVAIVAGMRARQMHEQFEAYKARLKECL